MCGRNSRGHCFRVEVAAIAPFERAGGMQHRWGRDRDRCSNLHHFLWEAPGLHDRFEPRGERCRSGVSGQVPRHRLTAEDPSVGESVARREKPPEAGTTSGWVGMVAAGSGDLRFSAGGASGSPMTRSVADMAICSTSSLDRRAGILNSPRLQSAPTPVRRRQRKSLPQLHVHHTAAHTRIVSAAPFRPNRQTLPRQRGRISIPTDSAVRVRPPQPASAVSAPSFPGVEERPTLPSVRRRERVSAAGNAA
jgi:hypothetical protein